MHFMFSSDKQIYDPSCIYKLKKTKKDGVTLTKS